MSFATPILQMFGKSPVGPLQAHMHKAQDCVSRLIPFLQAVLAGDWQAAQSHQAAIAQLEDEADELKKDLRLHLPSSLFSPIARGDLLQLLVAQDRIANKAEDIAGLAIGRQMDLPDPMQQLFSDFLQRSVDASAQAARAIDGLEELLATGFRGQEVKWLSDMIVTLDEIERDTDKQQVQLRQQLYAIEKDLPPIDVMFYYKLIDWTGDLADRAQIVGGLLQLILAR